VSQFLADSGVETSNDFDREIEAAVTGIEAKICTEGWVPRDVEVCFALISPCCVGAFTNANDVHPGHTIDPRHGAHRLASRQFTSLLWRRF